MSNVVPRGPGELSNPGEDFWGNLDRTDFAILRCVVGQGTSKDGKVPGAFNFSNKTHTTELLNCKLIVPLKTRVLYDGLGPARCGSDDYYSPSPRFAKPISNNCLTCPASAWGEDIPEKNKLHKDLRSKQKLNTPLCKETYNLLMADTNNSPFFLQFQGVQLKVVSEELFSRIRYDYPGLHPATVAFDMQVIQKTKGVDSWYQVEFSNFRECDTPDLCIAMYKAHSKSAKTQLAKQHAEMDAEKSESARPVNDSDWPPPTEKDEPPVIDDRDEIPF